MQVVAILGIVGLVLLMALYWYLHTSGTPAEEQLWIIVAYVVVGSAMLYLAATYIGKFGAVHEANMMVAGIQNIKRVI